MTAALLVGVGLAAVVMGVLQRGRERHAELAAAVGFASVGVAVERAGRLRRVPSPLAPVTAALEEAHLGMRPEAFVATVAAGGVVAAMAAWAVLDLWLVAPAVLAAAPSVASAWLRRRVAQRRRAFASQLPDALSMVASSLSSGHTLLRSFQLLCDEADEPLAGELGRVVREAQLGAPLLDALEGMSRRVGVPDLAWVVQAIRIQQEAGGRLADLLHSLAGFMRAREEVRREVLVLTAEGRMSMWVLGLLPVFLLVAMRVLDPAYVQPLFEGWGLVVLGLAAASVAAGVAVIRRMIRIEV